MLYERFIEAMDNIAANLLSSNRTLEDVNVALDEMEALQGRDPDFFVHLARVFVEGKPEPLSRLIAAQGNSSMACNQGSSVH